MKKRSTEAARPQPSGKCKKVRLTIFPVDVVIGLVISVARLRVRRRL
jgi:hypothetical protein